MYFMWSDLIVIVELLMNIGIFQCCVGISVVFLLFIIWEELY